MNFFFLTYTEKCVLCITCLEQILFQVGCKSKINERVQVLSSKNKLKYVTSGIRTNIKVFLIAAVI